MEIFFKILTGIMIMSYNNIEVAESSVGKEYKGHWKLDGSDSNVTKNGSVYFKEGRCPGSKAINFEAYDSFATVSGVDIAVCNFTISFWFRLKGSKLYNTGLQTLIRGSTSSGKMLYLFVSQYGNTWTFTMARTSVGFDDMSYSDVFKYHDSWFHVAVTCQQYDMVKMYLDGYDHYRYSEITNKTIPNKHRPSKKTYIIGPLQIMDLQIFGFALPPDDISDLSKDFPLIMDQRTEIKGGTVNIRWKEGSCSANVALYVYYREVLLVNNASKWEKVHVLQPANHYVLELKCFRQYEIAVTGWEKIDKLRPWKVNTGKDKLPPPVVENNETEIHGCDVNLTWSPPIDTGCPLTMYKIHYRDIQPGGNNTEWLQINVTQLNKTFYVMGLDCDTKYEIAMSAKDEERESGLSRSWRVNTKSLSTETTGRKRKTDSSLGGTSGKPETSISLESTAGIIAASVALVVMINVGICCQKKRKRNRKRDALLPKRSKSDIIPLLPREVPPDRVTALEELGRGAFGKVHRGVLSELPTVEAFYKPKDQRVQIKEGKVVAIKTLLETAGEEGKDLFLKEIEVMKQIGSHKNVLSMLGYWVKSEPVMLILEYVSHGDLLQWLRNKRQQIKFKNSIDGHIFEDLANITSQFEITGIKRSEESTENDMPINFITVKEEALMRRKLVFRAAGKGKESKQKQELELEKDEGQEKDEKKEVEYEESKAEEAGGGVTEEEEEEEEEAEQYQQQQKQRQDEGENEDKDKEKADEQQHQRFELENNDRKQKDEQENQEEKEQEQLVKEQTQEQGQEEEETDQYCHHGQAGKVLTKGKLGTSQEKIALSSPDRTRGSQEGEEKMAVGKEVNGEKECSEYPCFPLKEARSSVIDKNAHHTGGPSGSENKMATHIKERKEVKINMSQDDRLGDVRQNDDFHHMDLLCFAWQIAKGMDYLASKGLVHRDLAARNILLGDDKVVKIADFGLLRGTKGNVYEMKQKERLPIKWTAPEALHSSVYTTKSDVWSFGVLLWEMTTMGGIPYPGIGHKELYRLLKTGYRMDKPKTCSYELYAMMSDCWKEAPDERPAFEQLIVTLEEMMTRDTPYADFKKLDEEEPYYKVEDSNSTKTSGGSIDTKM